MFYRTKSVRGTISVAKSYMSNARILSSLLCLLSGVLETFSILNENELRIAMDVAHKLNVDQCIFFRNKITDNRILAIYKSFSSKNIFCTSLNSPSEFHKFFCTYDIVCDPESAFAMAEILNQRYYYKRSRKVMIVLKEKQLTTESIREVLFEVRGLS